MQCCLQQGSFVSSNRRLKFNVGGKFRINYETKKVQHIRFVTTGAAPTISSESPYHVRNTSPHSISQPKAYVPSPFTQSPVPATIYNVPSMEPRYFKFYSANHLHLPFRRDILHRAVIYEGDMTRQGTASTKWRSEVRGSGRKIRPQKGMGKARLGDKKSPMLRGGGVAFGPKPRDFSTDLPRKLYDLAWRTALSYRYRRGELIVINSNEIEINGIKKALRRSGWESKKGKDLIISSAYLRTKAGKPQKTEAMEGAKVDVKDILKSKRVIIDEKALDEMLDRHQSDLVKPDYLRTKV